MNVTYVLVSIFALSTCAGNSDANTDNAGTSIPSATANESSRPSNSEVVEDKMSPEGAPTLGDIQDGASISESAQTSEATSSASGSPNAETGQGGQAAAPETSRPTNSSTRPPTATTTAAGPRPGGANLPGPTPPPTPPPTRPTPSTSTTVQGAAPPSRPIATTSTTTTLPAPFRCAVSVRAEGTLAAPRVVISVAGSNQSAVWLVVEWPSRTARLGIELDGGSGYADLSAPSTAIPRVDVYSNNLEDLNDLGCST